MLSTQNLTKRYGNLVALDQATIQINTGECVGVLGPNGAGKSTLFRILMGFLRPSSGKSTIGGFDCHQDKQKVHSLVSYLPGDVRLFGEMKGRQVLEFFSDIHPQGNREKAFATARRLELDLSRRVAFMSTGMRQKLGLSIALSSLAPMLIMDEPTTSLDPSIRAEVIRMIGEANREARTVLICSHVLSEIEDICSRAIIMRGGQVVHDQALEDLSRLHRVKFELRSPLPKMPENLKQSVLQARQSDFSVRIDVEGDLREVMAWVTQLPIDSLRVQRVDLREIYDRYHSPETVVA